MAAGEVSADDAALFLADRYGRPVSNLLALSGGDWSRAFGYSTDGRRLVVRFGAWRADFEADQRAMSFAGPDLPVPRLVEIGETDSGFYAISERHDGDFLEELVPPDFRRVLPALLRALDALRGLPTERDSHWHDWLRGMLVDQPGGRVSGWREQLARFDGAEPAFDAGRRAMESLLPACPELGHVVHRDLVNRNVLTDPRRSRIAAVLDWGCMVRGDFVYDIAWLRFCGLWHASLATVDWRAVVLDHFDRIGLQVEQLDARLRCYELHIGLCALAYNVFRGCDADVALLVQRLHELM